VVDWSAGREERRGCWFHADDDRPAGAALPLHRETVRAAVSCTDQRASRTGRGQRRGGVQLHGRPTFTSSSTPQDGQRSRCRTAAAAAGRTQPAVATTSSKRKGRRSGCGFGPLFPRPRSAVSHFPPVRPRPMVAERVCQQVERTLFGAPASPPSTPTQSFRKATSHEESKLKAIARNWTPWRPPAWRLLRSVEGGAAASGAARQRQPLQHAVPHGRPGDGQLRAGDVRELLENQGRFLDDMPRPPAVWRADLRPNVELCGKEIPKARLQGPVYPLLH